MWTIFHHLKHEHRYCKWVSDLYSYFYPPEPSPPVRHLPREDSSCDHQFLARPGCHKSAGSSLRHVFSGWRPRPNWRWPDAAPSPECAHASRFLRTTLASAVTLRTCDGLTLTRGDIGGSGSTLHGDNIFRWRSLNFKTTGQNYYGVYILSPGL